MKKLFLAFSMTIILSSCKEENHDVKEVFRDYLTQTLHDPDSFEEIGWDFDEDWVFVHKDTSNIDSPLVVDYKKTYTQRDSNLIKNFVRLRYRARNGFNALRSYELYGMTYNDGKYVQFEDVVYSFELNSFINNKTDELMNPKRLFLRNEYLHDNSGEATIEDFWHEYPEYK